VNATPKIFVLYIVRISIVVEIQSSLQREYRGSPIPTPALTGSGSKGS